MKLSSEEWLTHVELWSTSGLSIAKYCNEFDLRPTTLHSWKVKVFGVEHKPSKKNQSTLACTKAIVQVPTQKIKAIFDEPKSLIQIYINDIRIEVPNNVCPSTLRQVLYVLKS